MTYILYFFGLLLGLIAFIYIMRGMESGKKKIQDLMGTATPISPVEPKTLVYRDHLNRPPGTRMCPLCATILSRYEALYASRVEIETGQKILIHGCPYCYKPEKSKKNPQPR